MVECKDEFFDLMPSRRDETTFSDGRKSALPEDCDRARIVLRCSRVERSHVDAARSLPDITEDRGCVVAAELDAGLSKPVVRRREPSSTRSYPENLSHWNRLVSSNTRLCASSLGN